MPTPNSVSIEILNVVDEVQVSTVLIDNSPVTNIDISEEITNLKVELSEVSQAGLVQSVNGKTGHVVLDYPDISDTPVNHVRYYHLQQSIPVVQPSGTKWAGYYIWTINHNLNFYPNIAIFDSGDNMVEAYVDYDNSNTAIIVMNSAISGYAYLS